MNPSKPLQPITYVDGDVTLNSLITSHWDNNPPGVLLLPAWFGIDDEAKDAAIHLQTQGYSTLIADIYGEGHMPETSEEASEKAGWYKQHFEVYQRRISAALDQLVATGADPNKIAVIGFCFGGTGALEAARGNLPVAGVVCIHGALYKDPKRENSTIHASVLVEHPADDHTVSKSDYEHFVREMNACNADWQLITYGHSKHTFTNPQSADYHEKMAIRAWSHTLSFLAEVLK